MLPEVLRPYRRPISVLLHLLLIPAAYGLVYLVRFDFEVPERYRDAFWLTVPLLVLVRMASFVAFGTFKGFWRHSGVRDLLDLVKAISVSSGLFVAGLFLLGSVDQVPRSVLFLDWAATIFLFGGLRFAVRVAREESGMLRPGLDLRKPALVVGAGEAAERLLRQLRRDPASEIRPVALVDDDPGKLGMRMHGIPVVDSTERLARVAQRLNVRMIVIAIPSAERDQMMAIVQRCIETGLPYKIVPQLHELLDGTARVSQLRDVEIEDLLGRDAVELDLSDVRREVEGQVVLVTGGAGSIGSELARQVVRLRPERLIVLDQAESALYFIQLELQRLANDVRVVPVICDITDLRGLERVFAVHRPNLVFHAAAYKHVPLMEANVEEAVRNNVLGTLRVASYAAQYGAAKMVLISTDKAVRPSSVMGATKRIAERIVLGWPALRRSRTDFRAVRFGNVLGSDGSVLPLFRRQLKKGGPLTVTHPDVTRYFMTIPEAVQLVLLSSALPEAQSRISMLEMGAPVRIIDLAENLVRLSGLEPYRDIPIVFAGLRPGEKLHEELMSEVEETVPTTAQKIRVVRTDEPDGEALQTGLDHLLTVLEIGQREELAAAVCTMVPECVAPLRNWMNRTERVRA